MQIREMYMSDLVAVLAIIEAHDEDDGEAAREDYADNGVESQFVAELDGKVIGVTGYREVPATDHTYWLSWTYLNKGNRGAGLGKEMLAALLGKLREAGGRKLFVKVSDYKDPEAGDIYQAALALYQSQGFEIELTNNDFYDENENQMILGLNLSSAEVDEQIVVADEKPTLRFNGLYEIAETEGAYSFSWIVKEKAAVFGKRNFSVEDLELGLRSVLDQGGRKVFLTFPSNLPLIHKPLQAAGFKYVGQLRHYYECGVHELHFVHDLAQPDSSS